MSSADRSRIVGLCPPNPPAFISPPGCRARCGKSSATQADPPVRRLRHGARETRTALVARQVPVPVPPRMHGRAGTAGTIARIGGENDPHGSPTCPTAFRDLRGLCFETLTDCPRSNRKIRISPCPIPRSHVGIPVTGTASVSDSRRYSGTLALQTAAYNSQRNTRRSNSGPGTRNRFLFVSPFTRQRRESPTRLL